MEFTLEYGLTNRVTFLLQVPYFLRVSQTNEWGWGDAVSQNADLQGFVDYHKTNKAKFEQFFGSEYFDSLDENMAEKLRTTYDVFYTSRGKHSVLWALTSGTDPYLNGLYGAHFNPFSDEDTVATTIDSLLAFYHPDRDVAGLGDIRWGFVFLLSGSPVWAGESMFSLYGGMGMVVPTGTIIQAFNPDDVDASGRPRQFHELPLGGGVTQWQFSLFGEFYRSILERTVRINWRVQSEFSIEGKFWPRITPRGLFTIDHDKIVEKLGEVYRSKRGNVLEADVAGFFELIPDRLSATAGQRWNFKARDQYHTDSQQWNEWMAGGTDRREGYDTRAFSIIQKVGIIVHNLHPLKKFGPVPFELTVESQAPFFTRHSWASFSLFVDLSVYFQFW
ncbi:MAG: hypothetical protein ACE5GH_02130 [Fidelibacterota bacterium]